MDNELYDSVIFVCKLRRLIHHTSWWMMIVMMLLCVGTIIPIIIDKMQTPGYGFDIKICVMFITVYIIH